MATINDQNQAKMKTKLILPAMLALIMCACSDETLGDAARSKFSTTPTSIFSFDSIEAPSNWAQYQTLEEMLSACQIPREKLKLMSTDELIEVCMSHPLHALYFAYNNELDGANVIFNHFNGFTELNKRTDAADKMLTFYEDVNFNDQVGSTHRKDFSDIIYSGFIDLYVASKQLKALYNKEHLQKLELVSNRVLEKKLSQSSVDANAIRRSLLINSQVKLMEGNISQEDANKLKTFIWLGGNVDSPQVYSEVSAIVAK